ncbi:MAG TPA: protein kinase [Gemmatimonadaceae bacterium]
MANTSERLAAAVADRYVFERELGSGGMATVYLAQDLKHGRKVAIKVLRPELAAALGTERFVREIEIAAKLTHPHILPLFDSGEADGFLYYVMPYVEGESLRDRLNRESRLSVPEAIRLTDQIASALAYAHERGVVHRDIKPENIMLAGDQAIVADFGIARAVEAAGGDGLTGTGIAIGTPAYMSPEQAFGSHAVDGRTDVYALGCVVYEMVCGRPLFDGPTQALLAKHAADTVPRMRASDSQIPLFVERAVERALAKDPADRFPTAGAFAEALTTGTVVARGRRRHPRRAVLVLAGGMTAALVGAGLYIVARGGTPDVRRITVAPFEDRTGDPRLAQVGDLAADWITRGLTRVESLEVTAATVAREMWLAARDAPGGQVRTLAEQSGAAVIVSGTYSMDGDALSLAVEIIDARSGRLIANVDPVTGAASSATQLVAALAERVTAAVAAGAGQPAARLAATSPPSLEAFREYQQGMDAFSRGQWNQSIVHYRRAIAIDSTYPPPVVWAATAYRNLGQWAAADTLLQSISPIVDRLTPIERVNFEWQAAIGRGDPEGRLRWAEEGFRLNPRSWSYPLGLVLVRSNQPRRALEVFRQYDRDSRFGRNWEPYFLRYGEAQHMLGDYRGELRTVARLRGSNERRLPDLGMELRALTGLGRTAEIRRLLEQSFSLPPQGQGQGRISAARVAVMTAAELRAHGHRAAALATLHRFLNGRPAEAIDQQDGEWLAQAMYLTGQWTEARTAYDSMHQQHPDEVDYVGWLGVTRARLGERAAAAAMDSALADFPDVYLLRGRSTRWRARIAAVLGDPDRAIRLLQQARAQGMPIGFELHAEMDFESLADHAAFQGLHEPKG